jgi:hypothetical protein
MKLSVIVLSSFLLASVAHAQDVCFSEDHAGRMLQQLEQTQNLKEQVDLYERANQELEYQVKLLKEVNALQREQVGQYKELLQIQREGYESIIKESKPNAFKEFINKLGFMGIGALVGMALML